MNHAAERPKGLLRSQDHGSHLFRIGDVSREGEDLRARPLDRLHPAELATDRVVLAMDLEPGLHIGALRKCRTPDQDQLDL